MLGVMPICKLLIVNDLPKPSQKAVFYMRKDGLLLYRLRFFAELKGSSAVQLDGRIVKRKES